MIIFIDDSAPGGGGSGSTTTWSPTDKTSTVALSGGNLIATFPNDGNNKGIRSTTGKTSGKWYWEVNITTVGATSGSIGIKRADANLITSSFRAARTASGTWSVSTGDGLVDNAGGSVDAYTTGDVLMFAMDLTSGFLWTGKNGTWQGGGNPAAGTGYQASSIPAAVAWHAYSLLGDFLAQKVNTINCGATAFTCTPPSGFSAL